MSDAETNLLNAVLENKDISTLYTADVDTLFVSHEDVWDFTKKYYTKYGSTPAFEEVQKKFSDFQKVKVSGPTEYYLDEFKNGFMGSQIDALLTKMAIARKAGRPPALILEKAQNEFTKLNRYTGNIADLNAMDFEDAETHYQKVRELAEKMGGQPGISTGIKFIDSANKPGMGPGDLVILLGWTGRGKSLTSSLIACNAHAKGFKPMVVSLEMSGQKVRDRIYTIKGSGVFSNTELSMGKVNLDTFRKFTKDEAGKPEFIIVTNEGEDAELTPNRVEAKVDQHRPDLVIIDYAQLASDNEHSLDMKTRMLNMSKQYKRLAVRKGIVVILISSATMDSTASINEPPIVEQVAYSKQLAFDADLAMAVHRYPDSNLIGIVGRKNRNGDLWTGTLEWDIDRGTITERYDI